MANLNKVFLIGNLTKDPELRYIPSGSPVADLRLAVNRVYKVSTGEQKSEVCYMNIVVWGKQAESCSEHLHKGSPIFVEGRLQNRSWEEENGQKRNILQIVGERIQFLEKRKETQSGESDTGDSMPEDTKATESEEAPF